MIASLLCFFSALALSATPVSTEEQRKLVAPTGGFIQFENRAIAYIPGGVETAAPVLIVLHGNGGNPGTSLPPLLKAASERKLVLLAVKSQGRTWDALNNRRSKSGGLSVRTRRMPKWDKRKIEEAVDLLGQELALDRSRVGVYGFSDGASMALSLAVADPERYRFAAAFSPGGLIPGSSKPASNQQRIFITHGTGDRILPYSTTSRSICPYMNRSGRVVRFFPFEGGHVVDRDLIAAAMDDFLFPEERPAADSGQYGCGD